jgi:predicted lipoprotein with Yx(FWY)xxD motif
MYKTALLAAAGIGALLIAGCSSSSTSPPAQGAAGGGSATTVAARSVSGIGHVLVDSQGRTLYESDQEKSGKVLCSSSACTAIWSPLLVARGQKPTEPSNVSARLGTVTRPDGKAQVTLDGAPLYTFSFDHSPGDVNGNGQHDNFDGTSFTWHAATPTGAAAARSTARNNSGGYGGGGYGGYGG